MDHGLHLRSSCNDSSFNVVETDQIDQRVVMKQGKIKEEPCEYKVMVGCEDEEEKPSAVRCSTEAYITEDGTYEEAHLALCKTEPDTETDVTLTLISDEVQQTAEEEQDSLLEISKLLLLF